MANEAALSATAKAHGMDGTLVEPDWPPLTLAELRALFLRFPDLGEPARILTVSPRPFSAAGIVATRNERGPHGQAFVRGVEGRVFVKRHHRAVRDREGLLEEHRFLAHLLARSAPVPRVLASASGETAIEIGNWTYEVHETPAGIDLYEDAISWTPFRSSAHAQSAGAALARLHLAARDFAAPPRKPQPLVVSFTIFAAADPAAAMNRYLSARPSLASHEAAHTCAHQALELLAPFHAELAPALPALPPLWTHNDLHASNLFWSDAGPETNLSARATAIIDFGLADRTNAVHDLAHAIERNIVEWLLLVNDPAHPDTVPIHLDHLEALLDGYEFVRPLANEERAALAPMTALCHAEFALTEADYFLGVLHSEEKGRLAYGDYLVGHARWFRSAPGRSLLDALREWAARRKPCGHAETAQ
ncbi:MAG: phosphotransferase enzyme family protein [Terracidiphilus sp.]